MARKSMIVKSEREPKYKVRKYTRCKICGRPTSFSGRHWKVYNTYCSLNCKNEDKDIMYSTKQEDSCYELLCQYFGKNNDF